MFVIREDDLSNEPVRHLISLHLSSMHTNSPPGHVFALDLSGLKAPGITVWSVWDGEELAGIGAFKALDHDSGEIKSMRTHPKHLRKGVATALLLHIIDEARRRGYRRLSLETGSGPEFEPALQLYRKHGFAKGDAFGDYIVSDFNQFFHLELLPAPPDDGWAASAEAWIKDLGEAGDYSRRFVLDAPMAARVQGRGFRRALDVGCGEGRFCRMMRNWGIHAVGLDPTEALLARARMLDPGGEYHLGRAEALQFDDESFDLVISYLSLIDIPDIQRGVQEMARVLKPGGTMLIANLNGFATTGRWIKDVDGTRLHFAIDRYLESRPERTSWRGIDIVNWHRPLSIYMQLFIGEGLLLRHFDEPPPAEGAPETNYYRRVPWHLLMEWLKPVRALRHE